MGSRHTLSSQPSGRVSVQVRHQDGSPCAAGDAQVSGVPRGANAQPDRDCPASSASWSAVLVRLIRAGSATRGGAGPPTAGVARHPGLAQPWPMAMPWASVMVTQMVLCGLAAAVAARVRHSSGSRGPRPCPSPGLSARPRSVARGKMRSCRAGRGRRGCAIETGTVLSPVRGCRPLAGDRRRSCCRACPRGFGRCQVPLPGARHRWCCPYRECPRRPARCRCCLVRRVPHRRLVRYRRRYRDPLRRGYRRRALPTAADRCHRGCCRPGRRRRRRRCRLQDRRRGRCRRRAGRCRRIRGRGSRLRPGEARRPGRGSPARRHRSGPRPGPAR